MTEIRVLFVCAAGMSSSIIKSKVEAEAQRQGTAVRFEAVPAVMISADDFEGVDVVLVAPQVRSQIPQLRGWADGRGAPIEAIGFQEYGLADAPKILEQVRRLAGGTG